MGRIAAKIASSKPLLIVILVSLLIGAGPFSVTKVHAADLIPRSITISDSVTDASDVSYDLIFSYTTASTVGSVIVEFCQEGPLPNTACTQPPGFDATDVVLSTQSGVTGFTVYSGSTANAVILTRPPAVVSAGAAANYVFANMVNPSDDGALYVRVATYASSDATGPYTDFGGLVLAINQRPNITAEVPPFLSFCLGESISGIDCSTATEPFSDIGTLHPLVTGAAQSQILAATNGDGGYTMWVQGGTMTSGNNTIPAMAGGASQKGTSQFGINLRANTSPIVGEDLGGPGSAVVDSDYNQQNKYRYASGDILASTSVPDDYRKYTVSYIVNVSEDQPGGVYATTLTYICLGNF